MDNQIQKQSSNSEKTLIQNLQVAIMDNGAIDTKMVDRMAVNIELRRFKTDSGAVNYPVLFDIPKTQRLAAMAKESLRDAIGRVTVALTLAFEVMNLARPMTAAQVVDLAEAIVDSSGEQDNLAFEDLMIFLQKLTRGEYGNLYESMDIPKFMGFFDKYRDERWEAALKLRDEREAYYKNLGDPDSYDRTYRRDASPLGDQLAHFSGKVQAQKDEIRELRGRLNDKK